MDRAQESRKGWGSTGGLIVVSCYCSHEGQERNGPPDVKTVDNADDSL